MCLCAESVLTFGPTMNRGLFSHLHSTWARLFTMACHIWAFVRSNYLDFLSWQTAPLQVLGFNFWSWLCDYVKPMNFEYSNHGCNVLQDVYCCENAEYFWYLLVAECVRKISHHLLLHLHNTTGTKQGVMSAGSEWRWHVKTQLTKTMAWTGESRVFSLTLTTILLQEPQSPSDWLVHS